MEFITSELTKKLKEKGFDYKRVSLYDWHKCINTNYGTPTISQVFKWLREKGIHINIEIFNSGWFCSVHRFIKEKDDLYKINRYLFTGNYNDYEEATLNAIEYILDNNLI